MNLSLVSVITTLKPAIHIAAIIPFLLAIVMWLIFYTRYDLGKLKKIRNSFKKLADEGDKIRDCNKENISFMDEMIIRMAPPYFLEAWLRMQMQIEKNFQGDFIPEGQSFYEFDTMITTPGCRSRLDSLWRSFWVLSIFTAILPFVVANFIQPRATIMALALGVIFFMLLSLGFLIFTMQDQKIYFSTKTEYHRFIATFNRVLPTAKAEVVLLLEATQRNQEAYEAATQKIVEKFDTIVDDTLLPALEDSIEVIMRSNLIPAILNIEKTLDTNLVKSLELQKNGIDSMAMEFADRLGDTVEAKMIGLADTIGNVQGTMETLNQGMADHVQTLTATMTSTLDLQEKEMERIGAAFTNTLTNTLDDKMTHLSTAIGRVQTHMEKLNLDLGEHLAGLDSALTKSITVQEDQMEKAWQHQNERMAQSVDLQEKAMERISTAFADNLTSTLEVQMSSLAMTISDVRGQMEEFNFSLGNHITELMETNSKSIELQREQAANSITQQDERIRLMLDTQDDRIDQMMDAQDMRINQLIEHQTIQMAAITTSFTESLTSTLQGNISSLNQEIGGIQTAMGELNSKLTNNIQDLTSLLDGQQKVLDESAKILINSGEIQEKSLAETKEIQRQALENSQILKEHVEMMAETIDRLTEQTTAFSRDAFKFTKETNEAQIRMSDDVKLSQTKLESAVNETMGQYAKMNNMISDMMDNITERMNDAMTNAGREIAYGIKEVTADNAEAIGNLTEQAQNLRNDYETYFSRLEDNTVRMIEDMDYQVKTIIARISEDIGAMMKENIQANAEILDRYKDNTTDLLQSFDEQARSIGLYAKEINMDITDLSNNLQASVGEFSSKMQEGVRLTLSEFDSGLSELTQRIANTVESISDAVESLPEALGRK